MKLYPGVLPQAVLAAVAVKIVTIMCKQRPPVILTGVVSPRLPPTAAVLVIPKAQRPVVVHALRNLRSAVPGAFAAAALPLERPCSAPLALLALCCPRRGSAAHLKRVLAHQPRPLAPGPLKINRRLSSHRPSAVLFHYFIEEARHQLDP